MLTYTYVHLMKSMRGEGHPTKNSYLNFNRKTKNGSGGLRRTIFK